jgi:hypothetical protein
MREEGREKGERERERERKRKGEKEGVGLCDPAGDGGTGYGSG